MKNVDATLSSELLDEETMKNPRRTVTVDAQEALDLIAQADELEEARLAADREYKRLIKVVNDATSNKKRAASAYISYQASVRDYKLSALNDRCAAKAYDDYESLVGQFELDEKALLASINAAIKESGTTGSKQSSAMNSLFKKWQDAGKKLDDLNYKQLDAAGALQFASSSK